MEQKKRYNHPFEPYDIQYEFMDAVYKCLDEGKVGIFESPTGTGKSLSLICGAITWAREQKSKSIEQQLDTRNAEDDNEPEWMVQHAREAKKKALLQQRKDFEARLAKVREHEKRQKQQFENGEPIRKRFKGETQSLERDESSFLIDNYESDGEQQRSEPDSFSFSSETQALMKRLGMDTGASRETDEADVDEELKIFYCSRTHSQLTQFVSEMRRPRFPPSILFEHQTETDQLSSQVKHLALGSRKNYCINPDVSKLNTVSAMNEKCLELQKPDSKSKCSFLPTKENEALVNAFRDNTLARIRDIEEIGAVGKKLGICPYYAARPTIKPAEVVTLPYPLLLQKSAREALGFDLKDHVVIIDEAHNLMDTISNLYSVIITLSQITKARSQLNFYLQKFRTRLKGKNRVYVVQVVRLLDSLFSFLKSVPKQEGTTSPSQLLAGKGVDQINLHKLMHYLQESKLARKVDGYHVFLEEHMQDAKPRAMKSLTPVLTHIQSFFAALTNPSKEGMFFYEPDAGTARDGEGKQHDLCLKYMLLDPIHSFKEIVEDARAVILDGGTMSPMSDYTDHLLPYLQNSRVMTLSCGHVIPPENLHAACLGQGPGRQNFEFTFEKRNQAPMIDSLGRVLIQYGRIIPNGMVVFFPSYSYLAQVISQWKNGDLQSIWTALSATKQIFHESSSPSTLPQPKNDGVTESILSAYSSAVASNKKGALLLSVIGGSLSEGINFSDALGRGVFVVGLPFPNIRTPAWRAKIEHIETSTRERLMKAGTRELEAGTKAREAGKEFVENACMRAVNQCIGRAIRHKDDYAIIGLLDRRYAAPRIRGKLPRWIEGSLTVVPEGGLEANIDVVKGFFHRDK